MFKRKVDKSANPCEKAKLSDDPDAINPDPVHDAPNLAKSSESCTPNNWSTYLEAVKTMAAAKDANNPELRAARLQIIRETFTTGSSHPCREMGHLFLLLLLFRRKAFSFFFYVFLLLGLGTPYLAYFIEEAYIAAMALCLVSFLAMNFLFQFLFLEYEEERFRRLEMSRLSQFRKLAHTPSNTPSEYLCTPARAGELEQYAQGESSQASVSTLDNADAEDVGEEQSGTGMTVEECEGSFQLLQTSQSDSQGYHVSCCGTCIKNYILTLYLSIAMPLYIGSGFVTFYGRPYSFPVVTLLGYLWLYVLHYIIGLKGRCRRVKDLEKIWSS